MSLPKKSSSHLPVSQNNQKGKDSAAPAATMKGGPNGTQMKVEIPGQGDHGLHARLAEESAKKWEADG